MTTTDEAREALLAWVERDDVLRARLIAAVRAEYGDAICPAVEGQRQHEYEAKCKHCGQLGQVRVMLVPR